jgi:DNA-binding response OmpR family regulator
VDTYILRLRRKIEDTPEEPQHILTVHGLGYRFAG